MILKRLFILCLTTVILASCNTEKNKLVVAFNDLYRDILNSNYTNINNRLDDKSKTFFAKVTDPINLNIDSMILLGAEYNLPYTLAEYLAFNGDKIKEGNSSDEFYRYLGAERISIFSFQDGYYVDKPKLKKGKENFVALIKEDISASKRSWVQFHGDDTQGYKMDLLYTLQLNELKTKKEKARFKKEFGDDKTQEEYLRHFYWQNSGNNTEFDDAQLKLEKSMREGRAELIQSYIERGLMDAEK